MSENWSYVWDVMVICLFLGLATYIRRSFKFFRRFFIPNAIIAGFIGLILGPQILNLIPFNADHMGTIIYHLMSIGFTALALKDRNTLKNKDIINTGIIIVNGYVLQGILGFGLSVLMAYTFLPDLFPVFGMLLPLGYGQGAGQAYSMGKQWESLGFANGGNIGLSVAALGLLWACAGGIPLMNYMIKVKKVKPSHILTSPKENIGEGPVEKENVGNTESVDGFTIQLFTIGIIYLATYLTLLGSSEVLKNFGTFGNTLSTMLWGFSFIIAALYAILFRFILNTLKKKKLITREYTSNFLLERISGAAFDFMITASIAAISITILKQYLIPTMVIGTLGGIATIIYVVYLGKRMYKTDVLENILGLYGNLTGVVSTGLALVKEIDPKLESSAGRNLVLGSGAGLFVGFPLMLLLNVPVVGYVSNKPILYLWAMIGLIAYFVILSIVLYMRRVK
jgi:ESS family glutamate:Na+ symporter